MSLDKYFRFFQYFSAISLIATAIVRAETEILEKWDVIVGDDFEILCGRPSENYPKDTEIKWMYYKRNKIKLKDAENGVKDAKLFIGDVAFIDEAYYRCTVEQATSDGKKTTKASYYLNVTRVENVYSVEGDKIEIKCKHHNYSIGTVVNWSHGTISNVTLKDDNGVENATLLIESVTLDDAGYFTCSAEYVDDGVKIIAKETYLVRVRGKWAPLLPFLLICGEILILYAISRWCKNNEDEDEVDPIPEQNGSTARRNNPLRRRRISTTNSERNLL